MTLEEVIEVINEVIASKDATKRRMKIDELIDGVPYDHSKIAEIKQDIENLHLEALSPDEPESVEFVDEMKRKYGI